MVLNYQDVAGLFKDKQGIQEDFLFYIVTDQAETEQPRGLFIPRDDDSGELSQAIANGAIAAVWEKGKPLPAYTPNHFPVFFVNDVEDAVIRILQAYIEKQNGDINKIMGTTNFKFSSKKLLNENMKSYDIAVMLKKIAEQENDMERRG